MTRLCSLKDPMIKNVLLVASACLTLSSNAALAHNQSSSWQVIPVAPQMTVVDPDGQTRVIEPACALDQVQGPDGSFVPNPFHFFFKPGKKNKTVVFFNGGGACWDDATCVTSLALGDRPTYNPTVHSANSPIGAGGIFDDANPDNPFANWSKVFIPYCTGDLHAGSSDKTYFDVSGVVTGYPGAPFPVKHHGFDNFLAVMEWMKVQFPNNHRPHHHGRRHHRRGLKKMVVMGSSAGGYGATLNFPHLKNAFPRAKAVLVSDGAAASVTQGFLDAVFAPGGSWNLEGTMDAGTFGTNNLGTYTAATFNTRLFNEISVAYPRARIGQYTTEFDVVQIQFLKIMSLLDLGVVNPAAWTLSPSDVAFFGLWNYLMQTSFNTLAAQLPNYQYYIGAGTIHTVLTDAFATPAVPHPFYDESSAQGVFFSDWMHRLVNDRVFTPENVQYVP